MSKFITSLRFYSTTRALLRGQNLSGRFARLEDVLREKNEALRDSPRPSLSSRETLARTHGLEDVGTAFELVRLPILTILFLTFRIHELTQDHFSEIFDGLFPSSAVV